MFMAFGGCFIFLVIAAGTFSCCEFVSGTGKFISITSFRCFFLFAAIETVQVLGRKIKVDILAR